MSLSEDCELQELVKQTLEKSGSMSKIRAELRASVFLALEDSGCFQNMKTQNISLQNFSKTTDGVLLLCLIREFLEYFGLSFTASVFDPELASYEIYCNCKDRSKLSDQLNVSTNTLEETDGPLLSQMLKVIRNIQNKSKNQKSSEIPEEINNLQNCKSSDTSTEYLPLQRSSNTVHIQTESNKNIENGTESNTNLPFNNTVVGSKKIGESNGKSIPTQAANEKVTEIPKYNLSSLDDLPPLTSSFNSSKSNNGSFSKSKMNMLKAALKDTISETNDDLSSVASEDDHDLSPDDSANLNESIAEESQITAEDQNSS